MRTTRPPVVAIMGHIDHGKSTLVDYIRKSNITAKEAGGITQHIGAYEVMHKDKDGREHKLTLLDTPGHEAFSGIRERGASAADIAILVVSAEDGVKPQTLEAIELIKSSAVPYIVAITKIDRPGANIDRVKQGLAEKDIYVEGYGGNIPFAALSAVTGEGVDDLLELISLVAEIEKFETEAEDPGSGVVIESKLDPRRGVSATGVIKNGVLRRGMFAAAPGTIAPLRLILDAEGNQIEEIAASSPVQIIGWEKMPTVGSTFKTFLKKSDAEEYASEGSRSSKVVGAPEERVKIERTSAAVALPLIIKADVAGSLEAIINEVSKLSRERIYPQIIFSGIGSVSEGDVKTALAAENSVILSFNVKSDPRAAALAERSDIPIHAFNIIYELIDKVKELISEREPRVETEELVGKAKVLKLFSVTKDKQVIGARMLEGEVKKGAVVKIMRREAEIGKGKVKELQQSKVAVDSVAEGLEFGTMIESKTELAPGDTLEAFVLVTK